MKFFSDCSGECAVCRAEFCLAGHGDDDYFPATVEQVEHRLIEGKYASQRETMRQYLKAHGVEHRYIPAGLRKLGETCEAPIINEAADAIEELSKRLDMNHVTFEIPAGMSDEFLAGVSFTLDKLTDMQNGTAETGELRTVKAALSITGRGTVIVVKPLPADMNAANTQVLIQGRLLKIFGIEQSQFRKSEVGIVLGSQIDREEIQVGSSVEFVRKKQGGESA